MIHERANRHTLTHEAMATTFKLTVGHADPVYARQACAEAFAELERIEGRLSRFIESSDVSRINRLGQGQSTVVQLDTFECLRIALEVQRETRGAFDVAYGSAGPVPSGPRFELSDEDHAVRVLAASVRLDLGGIGKGFALDRMAVLLADWEVDSALLAASTSTLLAPGWSHWRPAGASEEHGQDARATVQETSGWPVTFGPEQDLQRLVLCNRALSGSGTAVKGDHIVDPRAGRPAKDRAGAWAGAPCAAVADALSTAFLVMTEGEIRDYCLRHREVSAHVLPTAAGKVQAIAP